jgi:hypothetical protein
MPVDLLRWEVELLRKDVVYPFVDHERQFLRDAVIVVLVLQEVLDSLDSDEGFVTRGVGPLGIEDRRTDDGREVGHVHPRAGLFVLVRERRDPLEEDEQDFHGVAIVPGKEGDKQV